MPASAQATLDHSTQKQSLTVCLYGRYEEVQPHQDVDSDWHRKIQASGEGTGQTKPTL